VGTSTGVALNQVKSPTRPSGTTPRARTIHRSRRRRRRCGARASARGARSSDDAPRADHARLESCWSPVRHDDVSWARRVRLVLTRRSLGDEGRNSYSPSRRRTVDGRGCARTRSGCRRLPPASDTPVERGAMGPRELRSSAIASPRSTPEALARREVRVAVGTTIFVDHFPPPGGGRRCHRGGWRARGACSRGPRCASAAVTMAARAVDDEVRRGSRPPRAKCVGLVCGGVVLVGVCCGGAVPGRRIGSERGERRSVRGGGAGLCRRHRDGGQTGTTAKVDGQPRRRGPLTFVYRCR